MEKTAILNHIKGQKLQEVRIQSVFNGAEIADLINVTFIKCDGTWIRIVTTDEMTKLSFEEDHSFKQNITPQQGYHLKSNSADNYFPEINKIIGKRIINAKELVSCDHPQFSFGLILYFEDNQSWIIRNLDYPLDKNEYLFNQKTPTGLRVKEQ
ncbi:MAG: hypothetical protein ACWA41_06545 [Putridiphycobacter sp.]